MTHLSDHPVKFITVLAICIGVLTTIQAMEKPSFHTRGTAAAKPTGALKPGEYWWKPQLSPTEMVRRLATDEYDWRPERSAGGSITIVLSSADRALYVYRNGSPIGRAA